MNVLMPDAIGQGLQILSGLGGFYTAIQAINFYRAPDHNRPVDMDKFVFTMSKVAHFFAMMMLSLGLYSFGLAVSMVPATTPIAAAVIGNLDQLGFAILLSSPPMLLSLMIDQARA